MMAPMENGGRPDQEQRALGMIAHVSPAVANLCSAGLLGFLVPLAIFIVKKESSPFVSEHAKESLNFRITWLILYVVLTPIAIFLAITGVGLCIVIPCWLLAWCLEMLLAVVAGVQAYDGKPYRYPFALRLIR